MYDIQFKTSHVKSRQSTVHIRIRPSLNLLLAIKISCKFHLGREKMSHLKLQLCSHVMPRCRTHLWLRWEIICSFPVKTNCINGYFRLHPLAPWAHPSHLCETCYKCFSHNGDLWCKLESSNLVDPSQSSRFTLGITYMRTLKCQKGPKNQTATIPVQKKTRQTCCDDMWECFTPRSHL